MSKKLLSIIICLSCLALASCLRPYKVEIQQGNAVNEHTVAMIQRGMTREEIMNHFGTPILATSFNPNEMVYVYSLKKGYRPLQIHRLFIYFQGDHVVDYKFESEQRR